MSCEKCGATPASGSQFCDRCGAPLGAPAQPVFTQVSSTRSPSSQTPFPASSAVTSGKAIGSLITGIFGLPMFPFAVIAIILGHISRSDIRRSNGRLQGSGLALTGLVFGYAGIALIPIALIVAAIAIPNLLRARIAANEASAISSLRTIHTAEISYKTLYPTIGYACTLSSLAGKDLSMPEPEHASLIGSALGSGTRRGDRFVLQSCLNSEKDGSKYQIVAYPLARNQTGVRAFCSDETGVIHSDPAGSGDECVANGEVLH